MDIDITTWNITAKLKPEILWTTSEEQFWQFL